MAETDISQQEAPPATLGLSDAPPAPPQESPEPTVAEPESPPTDEPTTAEPTDEAAWHGDAEDFDSFRNTDSFKNWLTTRDEERDEEREHELRTELGRGQSRISRSWGQYQQAISDANDQIGKVSAQLQKGQRDGTLTEEAYEELKGPLSQLAPHVQNERFWTGAASFFKEFTDTIDPGFYEKYEHEVWEVQANPEAARQKMERLRDLLFRQRDKKVRTAALTEWEKKTQARRDEEAKAVERLKQAPPANTAGKASGTIDNSTEKRAQRLAYGVDDDGNEPTAEDRAWLAARN